MTAEIVDFELARVGRTLPDDDCIAIAGGEILYLFGATYAFDGEANEVELWAADRDDAARQVAAMRASLTLGGQIMRRQA